MFLGAAWRDSMHSAKCTCHVFEARAAVELWDTAQASVLRDTASSFIRIELMQPSLCLRKFQPPPSVMRHPTFWEAKICSNAPLLSLAWNLERTWLQVAGMP